MNISRRSFLESLAAVAAFAAAPGCMTCNAASAKNPLGRPALQLYSIRKYIQNVGLEKALADVRAIGYEAVEFAGYYNFSAKQLKKMLADNGLVACGTHLPRAKFGPKEFAKTCEFERGYGNTFLCCPGGGNFPGKKEKFGEDFMKMLVDYYNKAAENCAKFDCKVGLHNHTKEFELKLPDGTTYWDYFFSKTDKRVLMEQDVGWTTCAGEDPCAQFVKYPGRSLTIHAKENGMGKGVKKFDAILGQPGQPGAKGVEWDRLFKATDADKVKWYVVECEKHEDSLTAVKASFEFLKSKGRV